MDSEEYERRIAHRFATFDQDHNGWIDRQDFSAAAAAVLAAFGVAARSVKGQALYSGAEAFWQGMAGIADVDGDQKVNRAEFVTGAVKRLRDQPQKFAEIARPFLHGVIDVAAEGGSELTLASAERALTALGVAERIAPRVAAALDGDGDGRITEEDVLSAFAAYYVTPLPDA
ncbi:EF-hand domain-containing protein [Streptomyces purpureus]|uniref:Calcium-binding protein n=1 Tax=Streptomyces purpureus TaxID=1951 RepID=A0A918LQ50_9ACTN|nr:EF-hand domain-containing protein [Streptomyces purpureus]GGT36324.1 calcium-binding protein [Streptomyces purpureus]